MDKARLRKKAKFQRQALSADQTKNLSRSITNETWEIVDWPKIHSIHSYLPITQNNEVDTLPLLQAARQANPNIKIATTTHPGLETFWLDINFKPLKKVTDNFQFGLVLVPMLAFDKAGYRLGYGGGFYDRFLAGQNQALVVGLCYELGHLTKLPHDEFDIPMHVVVTEKSIYKF